MMGMTTGDDATGPTGRPAGGSGALDRYFKITERGSSLCRELRGGLVR